MSESRKWIAGVVVRGDGRGRKLGFPTANLALTDPKEIPAEGVYAAWGRIGLEEKRLAAALHIGPRVMFGDLLGTVEIHFLDFPDQDLYDQTIEFQVVQRLRGVKKFETVDALISALHKDCQQTREVLANTVP